MKHRLNVGFITTVSGRWPRELPIQRQKEYGSWLDENLPQVQIIHASKLGDSPVAIEEICTEFRRQDVDLIIQVYGAFTGDDVAARLAENLNVPLVLWAPYEPPFTGGRLLANALVAATMNAASLHRLGYPCSVIYGSHDDPRAASQVKEIVQVHDVRKKLRGTRIGLIGYRPTAFYNSAFDEGLIRRIFGINIEETDLKVVFDKMAAVDVQKVSQDMADMGAAYDTTKLPEGYLENHSRLYYALQEVLHEQAYDFSALKCWPEMGNLKTTPCAVMSRLADENMNIACEGDMDATLAMVIEKYMTGLPPFICDMIDLDEDHNTLTYWHCGQAAKSLMDPRSPISLENHPLAGQGTAFYGTLKEGPVTIARFCNIGGKYKLFLLNGQAVATTRNTKGVMVNVKVEMPVRRVLDTIVREGVPHHYSIVWEDVSGLMRSLAGLLAIEVIEVI